MKRLHLRLEDLSRHEVIVMARVRIFYAVDDSKNSENAPHSLNWQWDTADGDYRRTNEVINNLLASSIGGEPLAQAFSERGVGLMQFAPSYVWPSLFVATQLSELLEPVFRRESPRIVVLYSSEGAYGRIWGGLVAAFATKVGAEIEHMPKSIHGLPSRMGEQLKSMLRGWGVAYLVRHLKRRFSTCLARSTSTLSSREQRPVVFMTQGARHWVSSKDGGVRDEQCYPVARALARAGFTDMQFVDTEGVDINNLRKRNGQLEGSAVSWQSYDSYCPNSLGYFFTNWRRLNRLRCKAMQDPIFNKHMTHGGVSLVGALTDTFRQIFLDVAFESHEYLVAAEQLIKREDPIIIVLTYETGPAQRSLIIESSRVCVPTFGLQHGMIFDNHYDYMHARVTTNPLAEPGSMAIPLRTCVWGELWRDNLVESGCYPSEAVAITGNWRYDQLTAPTLLSMPNNGVLTQRFDKCRRVVSILSAASETEAYVRICLDLVSELGDTVPLVKVHPSEKAEIVKDVISAAGFPAETLYSGNLIELLTRSDIVISQFSTVVTEAMLLNKSVIVVNLTGLEFANEYQKSGACLYATTIEELRDCLIRLIFDTKTIEDLAEGRKRFVERTFFRLDGASAQRVASEVLATAECFG